MHMFIDPIAFRKLLDWVLHLPNGLKYHEMLRNFSLPKWWKCGSFALKCCRHVCLYESWIPNAVAYVASSIGCWPINCLAFSVFVRHIRLKWLVRSRRIIECDSGVGKTQYPTIYAKNILHIKRKMSYFA